jgi:hypothetical protein
VDRHPAIDGSDHGLDLRLAALAYRHVGRLRHGGPQQVIARHVPLEAEARRSVLRCARPFSNDLRAADCNPERSPSCRPSCFPSSVLLFGNLSDRIDIGPLRQRSSASTRL